MDEITRPPNFIIGSSTASEPAASSRCSQLTRIVGAVAPAGVTLTVLPSTSVAQPLMTCTPFFFSSAPTPPVSLPTMPSFHFIVFARSMDGSATLMPIFESPAQCVASSKAVAAWMMALDGMQPTFRQVPPRVSPSISTVGMPSWPARIAAT